MNHRKSGRKLGVKSKHREAMMRNMVTSLFEHEKIQTTDTRAKELRKVAEKLITISRRGDDSVAAKRLAMRKIRSKEVMRKLFTEIGPRFAEVPGGYTKIIKVGQRVGDSADMSVIRLLDSEEAVRAAKGKKKKKSKKAAAPKASAKKAEAPPAEEETQPTEEAQPKEEKA